MVKFTFRLQNCHCNLTTTNWSQKYIKIITQNSLDLDTIEVVIIFIFRENQEQKLCCQKNKNKNKNSFSVFIKEEETEENIITRENSTVFLIYILVDKNQYIFYSYKIIISHHPSSSSINPRQHFIPINYVS